MAFIREQQLNAAAEILAHMSPGIRRQLLYPTTEIRLIDLHRTKPGGYGWQTDGAVLYIDGRPTGRIKPGSLRLHRI